MTNIKINKEKLIKQFKAWLEKNEKEYYPIRNDWTKCFVISENWIELHYDVPLFPKNKMRKMRGRTSRMRILPLNEKAKKFLIEGGLEAGIVNLEVKNII